MNRFTLEDFWGVAKYLVLFIACQLVATVILAVVFRTSTNTEDVVQTIYTMLLAFVFIIGHIFYWKSIDLTELRPQGLKWSIAGWTVPMTLAAMVCLTVINELLQPVDTMQETFEEIVKHPAGFLEVALCAPFSEELLFRGGIQGFLQRRYGRPYMSILISALIFGIIHVNPAQVIGAGLLGILLGWLYYRTRNLWYPIFLHAINNTLAAIDIMHEEAFTQAILSGGLLTSIGIGVVALAVTAFCVKVIHKETGR